MSAWRMGFGLSTVRFRGTSHRTVRQAYSKGQGGSISKDSSLCRVFCEFSITISDSLMRTPVSIGAASPVLQGLKNAEP